MSLVRPASWRAWTVFECAGRGRRRGARAVVAADAPPCGYFSLFPSFALLSDYSAHGVWCRKRRSPSSYSVS